MITIKTLRRAETELDNELRYSQERMQQMRSGSQVTENAALASGIAVCEEYLERHSNLLDAKFEIRKCVGKFNQSKGINRKTSDIAELEASIAAIDLVMGFGAVAEQRTYGQQAKATYRPGINCDYIDKQRSVVRGLTRQIQRLKDSCNGVNSSEDASEFISPTVLVFLKANNFID